MFYFEKLLKMAMAGIDGTSVIPTITNIAFAILLVCFLVGIYQSALRGGDLQSLATSAIKYLIVALLVGNWASVFRDVNGSFNAVANFIGNNSGAGDMFLSWMSQLQQQATSNPGLTFWDMITGDPAGTITVLLLIVAYLLYALAMIIFCFFYTLYGAILYVLGPLVLALIPVAGVGQLGKTYALNFMIWNTWGVLYSIFGALITAIQVNRVNDILGHGFLGFLTSVPDSVMLGLVSIFYALAVAVIPFISKRVVSGDVGSTAYSLVRAGAVTAGSAIAGLAGFSAGLGSSSVASASSGASGSVSAITVASSTPPPASSMPDFIRSGIASAMHSNSSPVPASRDASGDISSEDKGGRQPAVAISGSHGHSGYRPHSVSQVVSFNLAKTIGKAASGTDAENN
jgi:hypothetical protein